MTRNDSQSPMQSKLDHNLSPHFPTLKSFSRRKHLCKSPFFKQHREEIQRVTEGMEWDNRYDLDQPPEVLRVVHWNIERGKNLNGVIHFLKHHPLLKKAHVILLTETDIGMGRSGNRNVPREIAEALKMNYIFSNSYITLDKGDESEQEHDVENELGLHGTTILSRMKIHSFDTVLLPQSKDAFHSAEKRLGEKRALVCQFKFGEDIYDIAALHLDVHTSTKKRAMQMKSVLNYLAKSKAKGQILGGDLNSSTYNLHNKFWLVCSLFFKYIFGVPRVISHYMKPHLLFERPLFKTIEKAGFDFKKYNDMHTGTFNFEIYDPYVKAKMLNRLPEWFYHYLEKKLKPWNGIVPLKLDWFAGRGFKVNDSVDQGLIAPTVIERPLYNDMMVSDHHPILVDLHLN